MAAYRRYLLALFSVVQIMLLCCSSLLAQELSCTGVIPDPGPLGYKERTGDVRCEGFYRSPVSGFDLELLSLTAGPISFQLQRDATVYITGPDVSALKSDKLRVQARALPISTFYRMDAAMRSATTFKWPMTALHPAKLTADLIGIIGWIDQASAKTYIPLSVSDRNTSTKDASPLIAVLRPSVDLEKLFWRRWPEGKTGAATGWTSTGSIHRAGEPVRIEFQVSTGVSVIELSAKTVGSDDWANVLAQIYQP